VKQEKTHEMFKRAKLVEAIDASRRFIGIAEKAVAELDDWSGRDELSVPSSSKIFAEAKRESLNLSRRLVELLARSTLPEKEKLKTALRILHKPQGDKI
jgi:hypothetical protein